MTDYVDIFTVKDGKCNVCYKCFGSFSKSDVKSLHCGINMERKENDYNLYFWTESKHPIAKPSTDVGEPCRSVLPPMKHY